MTAGDRVVVLGAGPIGQAVCLAARDRGAAVLLADRVPERLEHARAMGAQEVVCGDAAAVAGELREWAGGDGVTVLIETTGVPAVVRSAMEITAPAGRLVLVALSDEDVSLPLGDFPIKELDVLGVSCCNASEFADAVDLVRRNEDAVARLITDEFAFERAPRGARLRRGRRAGADEGRHSGRALAGSRFLLPTAIAMWQSSRPSHLAREVQEPFSAPREGIPLHVQVRS